MIGGLHPKLHKENELREPRVSLAALLFTYKKKKQSLKSYLIASIWTSDPHFLMSTWRCRNRSSLYLFLDSFFGTEQIKPSQVFMQLDSVSYSILLFAWKSCMSKLETGWYMSCTNEVFSTLACSLHHTTCIAIIAVRSQDLGLLTSITKLIFLAHKYL